MGTSSSGRTWEDAASPTALGLARRFETDWHEAPPGNLRPDISTYIDVSDGSPGARLALLLADLTLCFGAGEPRDLREYRLRFPDLGEETLVALIYEEFCLREDAGQTPEAADYLKRFPEVAVSLRRVLDIHGLVVSSETREFDTSGISRLDATFPLEGETIAGFRLAEELGRGAFARVFLAEERQLADRPVALKVARNGSREPQTLARLQHTNIVPVYSYRTDSVTGLHLLCMPYYGRLTLAHILADESVRSARAGSELLAAIDRLGASSVPQTSRAAGRVALERRTYVQSIAWWGARMAEALDHAHERGVLHRDVKPSNVLVTAEAMPMLLDFNLAREVNLDAEGAEEAVPGGTLDYMAPEHIEEMLEGISNQVGVASDLYGLGVLLYEAIMGERPFSPPKGSTTAVELLRRAVGERRLGSPRLREKRPEVPAALEAVIRRCLVPEPSGRYASAADLAIDLQAVADDRPLKVAKEPWPDQIVRWLRRHHRPILAAAPIVMALALIGGLIVNARSERDRLMSKVRRLYDEGAGAEASGQFARAGVLYNSAVKLAENLDRSNDAAKVAGPTMLWTSLDELRQQARTRQLIAERTDDYRRVADGLPNQTNSLRFRLAGFGEDLSAISSEMERVFRPFFVFEPGDWLQRPDIKSFLDDGRRVRVVRELNELLFLWALALQATGEPQAIARSLRICDKADEFALPQSVWHALRARAVARLEDRIGPRDDSGLEPIKPAEENSAIGSFQWGYLYFKEGKREVAQEFLKRAVRLEPGNAWYQYCLGRAFDEESGRTSIEALRHYDAALALQPQSPWVRFSRAQVYRLRGAWGWAMEDFQRALSDFRDLPGTESDTRFETLTRLELGLVSQTLGDHKRARSEYDQVIRLSGSGPLARKACLNRATLDAGSGRLQEAFDAYDNLVESDPNDRDARLGRALIAWRMGNPARAETDLNAMIGKGATANAFSHRALVRLALGKDIEALADANAALRRHRSSAHYERIRTRILINLGRLDEVHCSRPEELLRLPLNGEALNGDLRRFADQLAPIAGEERVNNPRIHDARLTLAVVHSALGDRRAESDASRAIRLAPESVRALLTRGWIRHYERRMSEAVEDAERARALDPDDPRVWALLGNLRLDSGDPRTALVNLDRAILKGGDGRLTRSARARTLRVLKDYDGALRDWATVLDLDPDDPEAYLGRAQTFIDLREWDKALVDLEQAAAWTEGRPGLNLRIAFGFLQVLPARPTLLPRVMTQMRSAFATLRSSGLRVIRWS